MEELTTFTENYLRLHLLEVKGGTPVLRCLFFKIVENSSSKRDVDRYLALFKDDIKLAKPPTSAEYQILFPTDGATDINKWDISLLAYILIHCCTLDGQMSLKAKNTPKEILKKEVNSTIYKGDLDQFLKCESNKTKIDEMKGKNIITDKQYDRLYPLNNQTDINAWDIELLILVLFNLCHNDNLQKIRGICKDVVTREVQLCCDTSIDLNVFLRKHVRTFDDMRTHEILTDSQHQQLFPSHGVSDLGNWDDTVLSIVVLNACQTLSPRTINAVKKIRTLRKELGAHSVNTEIDNDTFRVTWTDLHKAMNTIILTEVPEIEAEIEIATDAFKYGPLDLKSAIATLKEYDAKYISILSKLTAMESSLATQLTSGFADTDRTIRQSEINMTQQLVQLNRKMDELILSRFPEPAYSESREIPCFTVIFVVRGKSKEAVDEVENIIKKAMDGIDDKDTEKVKEVIEQIKNILSTNDIKIVEIRHGSIILVVKCLSVRGLHNLLNIIADLKNHLTTLSTVFSERTGCQILIDAYIPRSSLQTIREEIIILDSSCESNEHQRSVKMRLKATSLKGMVNTWQTLHGRHITTSLQILSEKLSDELKENVEINIKFQPEEFLSALKSSDITASVPIDLAEAGATREHTIKGAARQDLRHRTLPSSGDLGPPLMSGNTSAKTITDVDLPTTTPVTTPLKALGALSPGDRRNSQQQARAYKVTYAREISLKIKEDIDECNIRGSCVLQDGSILLIDGNKLKRLDSSFTMIDCIRLSEICKWSELRCVCCISTTEAAVSPLICKRIQFVSVSGKLTCTRSVQLDRGCWCLGLAYSSGELYVFDSWGSIHVYSTDGKRLTTIDTCEYHATYYSLYNNNNRAVSDDGSQIYVPKRDGVMCLNKQGKTLWKFTDDYQDDDYQDECRTVCVGNDNTLFVSSRRTILEISPNGQEIGVIQADLLIRPTSMCFDRIHSRLIVTRLFDDRISVYDY